MSTREQTWGGAVRLDLDFHGRPGSVSNARELVADLCRLELASASEASNWVMASQELLENLAKYAQPGRASFDFELAPHAGLPSGRLVTHNAASDSNLARAELMLGRIAGTQQPVALYDELVAASGERGTSGLGLIRIRAEAGLNVAFSLEDARLKIVVSGAVTPLKDRA